MSDSIFGRDGSESRDSAVCIIGTTARLSQKRRSAENCPFGFNWRGRVTPTANISGRLRISCPDSCEAVQSESAVITAFDSELSPAVLSFGEKQPEVLRKSSPKFIHVTCCAASLYVLIQARQSGVPLSMRLAINSAEPWTSTLRRASVRRPLIGFDESRVAADTVGDPSLSPGAYPTSTPVSRPGRGFFLFRTGEYHQMPNQIDLGNTRG